jgi:hypothetical protein
MIMMQGQTQAYPANVGLMPHVRSPSTRVPFCVAVAEGNQWVQAVVRVVLGHAQQCAGEHPL